MWRRHARSPHVWSSVALCRGTLPVLALPRTAWRPHSSSASSTTSSNQKANASTTSYATLFVPSLLRSLLHRVPRVPGYESPAVFRWATYTFWFILDPLFRVHFRYWQGKRRLDKVLEKQHFLVNLCIGVIGGLTLYFGVLHHLLPTTLPDERYNLSEDTEEVLRLMTEGSPSSEKPSAGRQGVFSRNGPAVGSNMSHLPAFQVMRVMGEVTGRVHAVMDIAEIRQQQKAVKALLEEQRKSSSMTTTTGA